MRVLKSVYMSCRLHCCTANIHAFISLLLISLEDSAGQISPSPVVSLPVSARVKRYPSGEPHRTMDPYFSVPPDEAHGKMVPCFFRSVGGFHTLCAFKKPTRMTKASFDWWFWVLGPISWIVSFSKELLRQNPGGSGLTLFQQRHRWMFLLQCEWLKPPSPESPSWWGTRN